MSTRECLSKMAGAVPFLIPSEYAPAVRVRVRACPLHPSAARRGVLLSTYRLIGRGRVRVCVLHPSAARRLKRY